MEHVLCLFNSKPTPPIFKKSTCYAFINVGFTKHSLTHSTKSTLNIYITLLIGPFNYQKYIYTLLISVHYTIHNAYNNTLINPLF